VLVLPKNLIDHENKPVFFLAGPVLGGGDWQSKAYFLLKEKLDCIIAIPQLYPEGQPILTDLLPAQSKFADPLNWERHYMDLSATTGCLIFWLGAENETNPRSDGKPYAMSTRGELGEWSYRLKHDTNLRVVVGADPDFPGLRHIQKSFGQGFPIYKTLDETIEAAIKVAPCSQ
jgi:hypothetical protein